MPYKSRGGSPVLSVARRKRNDSLVKVATLRLIEGLMPRHLPLVSRDRSSLLLLLPS